MILSQRGKYAGRRIAACRVDAEGASVNAVERLVRTIDRYQQRHSWIGYPYAVVKKYGDDQAGSLAALISWYGFFSVFPLLLVFVSVVGIVLANDPDLQQRIIDSALARFPIVGPTIAGEIEALTGNAFALAVGVITTLWAGLGVVQAGQNAMNRVWDVPLKDWPNFLFSRLRSLVMLALLGALIVTSTVLSGMATVRGAAGPVERAWQLTLSSILNLLLFLLVFRVLPAANLRWRDVLPGAVVAGVLWTALQSLGGIYVTHAIDNASNVYGTFAVVIGLLVWIYLGAQLTMYCAEINVVRIRRLWPRSLVPPPLTDADRRALRAGALVEQRRAEQRVEVTFEGPSAAGDVNPADRHAGRPVDDA